MSIRGSVLKLDWSQVIQWAHRAIEPDTATVQVRLRDHHLYLLYEAPQCLPEKQTVSRLSAALKQNGLNPYLPRQSPPINKIFLSGRTQGAKLPSWTVKLEYDDGTEPPQPSQPSDKMADSNSALNAWVDSPTPKKQEDVQSSLQSQEATASVREKTRGRFPSRFTGWFNHRSSTDAPPPPPSKEAGGNQRGQPSTDWKPPSSGEGKTENVWTESNPSLYPVGQDRSRHRRKMFDGKDGKCLGNPNPSTGQSPTRQQDRVQPVRKSDNRSDGSNLVPSASSPLPSPQGWLPPGQTARASAPVPPSPPLPDPGSEPFVESISSGKTPSTAPEPMALNVRSKSETLAENPILSAPSNTSSPSSPPVQKDAQPETAPVSQPTTGRDVTSNISSISTEALARQGHPAAIASHLSEILGGLGVRLKVRRRNISRRRDPIAPSAAASSLKSAQPKQRLWVLCESAYSPDPSLLAEPIAQKLRELQLENYRDACILLQVQGEPKPDWMLRVDLTPPEKILKEWGRWGDAEAIATLLNQKLSEQNLQVRATLKESTLHLFCQYQSRKKSKPAKTPDQSQVMERIAPILETIAPQGIQAATVYGVGQTQHQTEADTPLWIDWLNLPAAQQQDLQPNAFTLAQQGNLDALTFLINRLINPDLDLKLATGGIRVMLLRKGNLLHVMTEGPTCPSQSQMAPPITQFLRAAQIQDLTAAKIYGRRSGQKSPLWRYGFSLKSTQSPPTTAQIEFAPPTVEADDLAGQVSGLVFRPNLPSIHLEEEEQEPLLEDHSSPKWRTGLEQGSVWLQQSLMATGLFSTPDLVLVSHRASNRLSAYAQTVSLALVWGALGCLLVWQTDLILAQLVQRQGTQPGLDPFSAPGVTAGEFANTGTATAQNQALESSRWMNKARTSLTSPRNAARVYPTFNSSQLDQQLARYQHYIAQTRQPPDILIIGSSRALRGINPTILEQSLQAQGNRNLRVFNFGVNGATLQVVDLIIRQVLPPEQLPKLILIADGVRAVNSGRVDRTYDSITQSVGYQQIAQGTFNIPTGGLGQVESGKADLKSGWLPWLQSPGESSSILELGQQGFKQQLQSLSASYPQRDRLKQVLQSLVNQQVIIPPQATPDATAAEPVDQLVQDIPVLESNGFLPMSVKFEPKTYYEKHSKVSGYYDGDYQGFELDGVQTTALTNLLQSVQPRGIDVVFVNMPLTQDYLDSVRSDYEQDLRQRMQRLETQTNLTFIDLGLAWQNQYDYFSDPSHLNQYGAAAVSQRLAQESRIPWPR